MDRFRALLGLVCICTLVPWDSPLARAQHWVNPNFECHRLDLRDLGYPDVNQIPANSSAITSLLAARRGKIYGGTSGDDAYLFLYDPSLNKVKHLGKIQGQQGIHHALVEDIDGSLYVGTGMNVLREVDLTRNIQSGPESVFKALWSDIKRPYEPYEGGHLYRYDPATGDGQVLFPEDASPLEDLGIAVGNNGIYALTIDPRARTLYGITYPDGHLFAYEIPQQKFRDLGEVDHKIIFHGPERDWRSLPRALVVDDLGRVYTSGDDGLLVYYDPKSGKIQSTGVIIPGEYYPVQAYVGHPVVEYLARDETGLVYGGSSDGFLFSFNPSTLKLVNLGKPRTSRRLRALTIGQDGRVYIVAGERIEPCRLFSFDPKERGFRDLGVIAVDRSPYYSWRGYQFDSIATGPDGTIYLGESERRSHLFLYLPE
jgi:outer membrane protein assembly factor BamB